MAEEYIPGVCNIGGKTEIRRRRNSTIAALIVFLLVVALLFLFPHSKPARLSLFIPAVALAICWQQWFFKFCVFFGIKGLFNFAPRGKVTNVQTEEFRRKDRAKVWKMFLLSLLFGAAVCILAWFI